MKRSLLFGLTLVSFGTLSGQIVITSADMPNAGDSVRVSYTATTGSVDYTLTDTNYVWDFSSLTAAGQERIEFNAATAFPFNFFSDFGVTNLTPDSLPGIGALPTDFTDYYKATNSSYHQVGISFTFAPIGSFAIPVIFSAQDYIYRFPLAYGNRDTSDAAYSLTLPGIGFIGQDKHRENYVDGWGTLITPLDTYQVVRVRSVVNAVDTISLDTTNQTGFSIPRPTEVQYKWLAPGMKYPVLEVDCQVILNAEVISQVRYQDSLRDSLFQVAVPNIASSPEVIGVYPNPADDQLFVQYHQTCSEVTTFTLMNIQGQQVISTTSAQAVKDGIQVIDISLLPAGIYVLETSNSAGNSVVKIVIN